MSSRVHALLTLAVAVCFFGLTVVAGDPQPGAVYLVGQPAAPQNAGAILAWVIPNKDAYEGASQTGGGDLRITCDHGAKVEPEVQCLSDTRNIFGTSQFINYFLVVPAPETPVGTVLNCNATITGPVAHDGAQVLLDADAGEMTLLAGADGASLFSLPVVAQAGPWTITPERFAGSSAAHPIELPVSVKQLVTMQAGVQADGWSLRNDLPVNANCQPVNSLDDNGIWVGSELFVSSDGTLTIEMTPGSPGLFRCDFSMPSAEEQFANILDFATDWGLLPPIPSLYIRAYSPEPLLDLSQTVKNEGFDPSLAHLFRVSGSPTEETVYSLRFVAPRLAADQTYKVMLQYGSCMDQSQSLVQVVPSGGTVVVHTKDEISVLFDGSSSSMADGWFNVSIPAVPNGFGGLIRCGFSGVTELGESNWQPTRGDALLLVGTPEQLGTVVTAPAPLDEAPSLFGVQPTQHSLLAAVDENVAPTPTPTSTVLYPGDRARVLIVAPSTAPFNGLVSVSPNCVWTNQANGEKLPLDKSDYFNMLSFQLNDDDREAGYNTFRAPAFDGRFSDTETLEIECAFVLDLSNSKDGHFLAPKPIRFTVLPRMPLQVTGVPTAQWYNGSEALTFDISIAHPPMPNPIDTFTVGFYCVNRLGTLSVTSLGEAFVPNDWNQEYNLVMMNATTSDFLVRVTIPPIDDVNMFDLVECDFYTTDRLGGGDTRDVSGRYITPTSFSFTRGEKVQLRTVFQEGSSSVMPVGGQVQFGPTADAGVMIYDQSDLIIYMVCAAKSCSAKATTETGEAAQVRDAIRINGAFNGLPLGIFAVQGVTAGTLRCHFEIDPSSSDAAHFIAPEDLLLTIVEPTPLQITAAFPQPVGTVDLTAMAKSTGNEKLVITQAMPPTPNANATLVTFTMAAPHMVITGRVDCRNRVTRESLQVDSVGGDEIDADGWISWKTRASNAVASFTVHVPNDAATVAEFGTVVKCRVKPMMSPDIIFVTSFRSVFFHIGAPVPVTMTVDEPTARLVPGDLVSATLSLGNATTLTGFEYAFTCVGSVTGTDFNNDCRALLASAASTASTAPPAINGRSARSALRNGPGMGSFEDGASTSVVEFTTCTAQVLTCTFAGLTSKVTKGDALRFVFPSPAPVFTFDFRSGIHPGFILEGDLVDGANFDESTTTASLSMRLAAPLPATPNGQEPARVWAMLSCSALDDSLEVASVSNVESVEGVFPMMTMEDRVNFTISLPRVNQDWSTLRSLLFTCRWRLDSNIPIYFAVMPMITATIGQPYEVRARPLTRSVYVAVEAPLEFDAIRADGSLMRPRTGGNNNGGDSLLLALDEADIDDASEEADDSDDTESILTLAASRLTRMTKAATKSKAEAHARKPTTTLKTEAAARRAAHQAQTAAQKVKTKTPTADATATTKATKAVVRAPQRDAKERIARLTRSKVDSRSSLRKVWKELNAYDVDLEFPRCLGNSEWSNRWEFTNFKCEGDGEFDWSDNGDWFAFKPSVRHGKERCTAEWMSDYLALEQPAPFVFHVLPRADIVVTDFPSTMTAGQSVTFTFAPSVAPGPGGVEFLFVDATDALLTNKNQGTELFDGQPFFFFPEGDMAPRTVTLSVSEQSVHPNAVFFIVPVAGGDATHFNYARLSASINMEKAQVMTSTVVGADECGNLDRHVDVTLTLPQHFTDMRRKAKAALMCTPESRVWMKKPSQVDNNLLSVQYPGGRSAHLVKFGTPKNLRTEYSLALTYQQQGWPLPRAGQFECRWVVKQPNGEYVPPAPFSVTMGDLVPMTINMPRVVLNDSTTPIKFALSRFADYEFGSQKYTWTARTWAKDTLIRKDQTKLGQGWTKNNNPGPGPWPFPGLPIVTIGGLPSDQSTVEPTAATTATTTKAKSKAKAKNGDLPLTWTMELVAPRAVGPISIEVQALDDAFLYSHPLLKTYNVAVRAAKSIPIAVRASNGVAQVGVATQFKVLTVTPLEALEVDYKVTASCGTLTLVKSTVTVPAGSKDSKIEFTASITPALNSPSTIDVVCSFSYGGEGAVFVAPMASVPVSVSVMSGVTDSGASSSTGPSSLSSTGPSSTGPRRPSGPAAVVDLALTFKLTLQQVNAAFKKQVAQGICKAAGFPLTWCAVKSVAAGSVVITTRITPDETAPTTVSLDAAVADLKAQLADSTSTLRTSTGFSAVDPDRGFATSTANQCEDGSYSASCPSSTAQPVCQTCAAAATLTGSVGSLLAALLTVVAARRFAF